MGCARRMILHGYKCCVPWFRIPGLPTCNESTLIRGLSYSVKNFLSVYRKNCSCVRPCTTTKYYIPESYDNARTKIKDDWYTAVFIQMTTNMVEHIEESLTYDFCHFLSDFGGSIGFLLGMSILSFLQFVVKVLQESFSRFKLFVNRYQRYTE